MSQPHTQPHDRFFKLIFSDPQKARALLQGHLSPALQQAIDLETLTPDTQAYVDEEIKEYEADLVFNCLTRETKEPLKIAFLLEHKSYVPKYIHFQLLRYMLNRWEKQIKQGEKPVAVIPEVVYHGRSQWQPRPLPTNFFQNLSGMVERISP